MKASTMQKLRVLAERGATPGERRAAQAQLDRARARTRREAWHGSSGPDETVRVELPTRARAGEVHGQKDVVIWWSGAFWRAPSMQRLIIDRSRGPARFFVAVEIKRLQRLG